MRARLALADCLWSIGRREDSVGHLLDMLRLNPGDNQGIRYLLFARLLELGRDGDFDRLVGEYDEPSAMLLFSKVLREFRRSGDSPAARDLLAKARRQNRYVVPLLLGKEPPHGAPSGTYSPGEPDEAMVYLDDFNGCWRQTPGAITWLRRTAGRLRQARAAAPVGPSAAAKKRLERLPQSYGTIWQAAIARVPTWLRDGEAMVRPWSILIVNHTEHLIIGQELVTQEPTAALLFDRLAQAMRKPLAGTSHRPSEIQVRDEPLWNAVQPHLQEIGVDCIFRSELEEADFICAEMQKLMRPEGQPPGLVATADFTSAQGAAFYDAAAKYFRSAPWRKLPHNAVIQVDCPQLREFDAGCWFAIVMGQSGQTFGLALYDNLQAVYDLYSGCCSADDRGPDATGLSLIFGECFEIPIADLVAAEEHHWPIAAPEAYPLVLCTEPGMQTRALKSWELQLLEGCARAVPDFVEQYPFAAGSPGAQPVPAASANLKFTLAWVEPAASGCGADECEGCEAD